jgi:hypothetical protein
LAAVQCPNGSTGGIYTSNNSGQTWTQRAPIGNWFTVASSADGSRLVAGDYGGVAYWSDDFGVNWHADDPSQPHSWWWISASSDGKALLGTDGGATNTFYTSADGGATWTSHSNPATIWTAVSGDGQTMFAAGTGNGPIYSSFDGGKNWTSHNVTVGAPHSWYTMALSSNASTLAAADYGGSIYTSSTWTTFGIGGSLSGGPNDAVELQYLGNGKFTVVRHAGSATIQ